MSEVKDEGTEQAEAADSAEETDSEESAGCEGDDFVIPGPPTPDGGRMCIHHGPDHSYRTGVMYPLEDGKPISPNAQLLTRREGTPLYDVVDMKQGPSKGPSKVNSKAFKTGWDRVFGKPDKAAN